MIKNYRQTKNSYNFKYRYILFISILFTLVGVVSVKLLSLHITDRDFLQSQGESRSVRVVEIPAYRGKILDRNSDPLAISTPVQSLWFEPSKIINKKLKNSDIKKLASILGISSKQIIAKAKKYKHREFVYLKRHLSPKVEAKIASLKLPGVHFQKEFKRFYPHAEVSSHVVGFTDIEGKGLEGIELAYNQHLKGKSGKKRIVQDLYGHEIERLSEVKIAEDGSDVKLSIDQRLQYLAHRALKAGVKKHKAKSGSAVIVSVDTGEILAMTNWPTFNPNSRKANFNPASIRNRAVTDFFEPGSTMKAFSMASILENTNTTADTIVNTGPGYLKLAGGIVRDDKKIGRTDVLTIMKRSSNVGITKLIQKFKSPDALWDTYNRFGFGSVTGINFPGESHGMLSRSNTEKPFVLATMAFGYGVAVTPVQLASAYATLGSHGVKRPLTLLKQDKPKPGIKVVSSQVARQVVDMLTLVARERASRAKIVGYDVAGKTGSARVLTANGYIQNKVRAVYGGLAPAINSKFAIVVVVNEPSNGQYYGNLVAAPVFSKIAQDALRLYKVPPDILETQGVYVAKNSNNKVIR